MKKILLMTALAAALAANVCSANTGALLPGPAQAKITNSKSSDGPAVTVQNNDSVPVYITAYAESGHVLWGPANQELDPTVVGHIDFETGYPAMFLQAACPTGEVVLSQEYFANQVSPSTIFLIPNGACTNLKLKK